MPQQVVASTRYHHPQQGCRRELLAHLRRLVSRQNYVMVSAWQWCRTANIRQVACSGDPFAQALR